MNSKSRLEDTYEICERLGSGSGGIVYKAYHKRLQTYVVLKKIRSGIFSSADYRRETDILKNLKHSYLPQVLDFLELEDGVYTVMSYIPGQTFEQLLRQNYCFSKEQLVRWGMQLSSALYYLHSQYPPVVHGDIKPANIILTPQGNICLIDFNISFYLDHRSVIGYSNGYSSPEQYEAATRSRDRIPETYSGMINERSDIYSAGATLYHLCTGKKYDNSRKIDFSSLTENGGYVFAQIIKKTLKKRPEDRFQSAYELFQAFEKMPEKDRRYIALIRKQKFATGMLLALLAGCIILSGLGVREYRKEQENKYYEFVEQQVGCQDTLDLQKEKSAYEKAVKIQPKQLESYYQHANILYLSGEYQKCVDFIKNSILNNSEVDKMEKEITEVYHIQADSLFFLESYPEAVECYRQIEKFGSENPQYYRDYAIALAYDGQTEQAQQILKQAEKQGLADDSLYYAKAEIEKSLQNYEQALRDFSKCIQQTTDEKLKARAYLAKTSVYEAQKNKPKMRKTLLLAQKKIPKEKQLLILQKLIQTDIDLASDTDKNVYRQEAIDLSKQLITMKWETFETYNNMVVLYEQQGNLKSAENICGKMKALYEEDYRVYKRYAFLELDKQQQLENIQRDYTAFADYYELAEKMYQRHMGNSNDTDEEMLLLEQSYQQVKDGGWI